MSNPNTPFGFVPYRHLAGGQIRTTEHKIASGYSASIKKGDAVILTSGRVQIAAGASTTLLGVFAGCSYRDPSGNMVFSNQWPAGQTTLNSVDAVAYVYTDRWISYMVQSVNAAAAQTNVGVAYDISTANSGSLVTGVSGMQLDLTVTTRTHFRVIGLVDMPNNIFGVQFAKFEVINNVPLMA